MRVYAQCGVCGDEQGIRGLTAVEQVNTVTYAFWSRHEHTPAEIKAHHERVVSHGVPADVEGDEP